MCEERDILEEVEFGSFFKKMVKIPRKLVAQKNFDDESKQSVQPQVLV